MPIYFQNKQPLYMGKLNHVSSPSRERQVDKEGAREMEGCSMHLVEELTLKQCANYSRHQIRQGLKMLTKISFLA